MIDSTTMAHRYRRRLKTLWFKYWVSSFFPRRRFVFGGSWHKFHRQPPCLSETVTRFEAAAGVKLPEDYASFLTLVGNGFAGPYYGISPLENWCQPGETRSFPSDFLNMPFSPTGQRVNGAHPGALRICNAGCEHYYVLVISGPFRGQIWHDGEVDGCGVIQLKTWDGGPMTCGTWLKLWLDDLAAGQPAGWSPAMDKFWFGTMFPGHAVARVLGAGAIVTVAVDQLPCPACVRLLLEYSVPPARVIVTSDESNVFENPKWVAMHASQVVPRTAFP